MRNTVTSKQDRSTPQFPAGNGKRLTIALLHIIQASQYTEFSAARRDVGFQQEELHTALEKQRSLHLAGTGEKGLRLPPSGPRSSRTRSGVYA